MAWVDVCNEELPPVPTIVVPTEKPETKIRPACSASLDVIVLIDERMLSEQYKRNKIIAFLKEVLIAIDIAVS